MGAIVVFAGIMLAGMIDTDIILIGLPVFFLTLISIANS